jgi:hypothetical protein
MRDELISPVQTERDKALSLTTTSHMLPASNKSSIKQIMTQFPEAKIHHFNFITKKIAKQYISLPS